ncbi:hypothetical protein, partial [Burkholderia mallei]
RLGRRSGVGRGTGSAPEALSGQAPRRSVPKKRPEEACRRSVSKKCAEEASGKSEREKWTGKASRRCGAWTIRAAGIGATDSTRTARQVEYRPAIADRSPTDRRPARKPSVRRIDRAARASRLSGAPSPNPFERARFDAGASSPRAAAHPRWRMSAVGVEPKSSLST